MSTKTITWIAGGLVVLLAGWYFLSGTGSMSDTSSMQGPGSGFSNAVSTQTPSGGSASNTDLSSGLAQLDAELNAAASASASADQGMNDKPIEQTE